ncbi:hypothetical protein GGR56DRAFT_670058 [Xylariaceae sp. FL0804]|nr:hypothetical protein GGR56DRAFT_670058 [Xylariaceae sp. FL0804]
MSGPYPVTPSSPFFSPGLPPDQQPRQQPPGLPSWFDSSAPPPFRDRETLAQLLMARHTGGDRTAHAQWHDLLQIGVVLDGVARALRTRKILGRGWWLEPTDPAGYYADPINAALLRARMVIQRAVWNVRSGCTSAYAPLAPPSMMQLLTRAHAFDGSKFAESSPAEVYNDVGFWGVEVLIAQARDLARGVAATCAALGPGAVVRSSTTTTREITPRGTARACARLLRLLAWFPALVAGATPEAGHGNGNGDDYGGGAGGARERRRTAKYQRIQTACLLSDTNLKFVSASLVALASGLCLGLFVVILKPLVADIMALPGWWVQPAAIEGDGEGREGQG